MSLINTLKTALYGLNKERDADLETKADDRLLLIIKARWFVISLLAIHGLLGITIYSFASEKSNTLDMALPGIAVFIFIAGCNTYYHIGWHKMTNFWVHYVKFFIISQLLLDVTSILLLIHFTGGVTSWLWPLFLVLNLELTFLLSSPSQVLAIGALTGLGFSALGFLEYNSFINSYPMPYIPQQLIKDPAYVLMMLIWVNLLSGFTCIISMYMHRGEQRELKDRIVRDGLTTLYNRRYFNHRLNSEIKRAERYGRVVSLIMFDIDKFKHYNDTFGHTQGDALLKWVADILKDNIRRRDKEPTYELDIACRYGGEEFAIILPEIDTHASANTAERIRKEVEEQTSGAVSIAERIRSKIEASKFRGLRKVTISAGIATFPLNAKDSQDLIDAADHALYRAKRSGRNKIIVTHLNEKSSPLKKASNN